VVTSFVAANATVVCAQVDPLQSIGVLPFSAQLPVENGYINAATGGLHLEIPLGTFPQRGGPQLKFALVYDSALWSTTGVYGWSFGIPLLKDWKNATVNLTYVDGWRLISSADPGLVSFTVVQNGSCSREQGAPNTITYKGFIWTEPNGSPHYFPQAQTVRGLTNLCGNFTGQSQPNTVSMADDASGYYISITNFTSSTVFASDGTLVYSSSTPATGIPEDSNGNYFTVDSNANLIDTLGRTPVTTSVNGNVITYGVLNSQGTRSTYTATVETINYHSDFASVGSSHTDGAGSANVIQSIALPDGSSYSFGYDSGTTSGHYGQLTSMTIPTGAHITYSYANFVDSEFDVLGKHVTRGISSRTSPDGTWTYTPAVITACTSFLGGCTQQMTVTAPSTDNVVYTTVLNDGAWPIEAQYYSGAVSAANLLATIKQSFGSSSCPDVSSCQSASNIRMTAATTTLPLPGSASLNQTTKYSWDISTNYGNLLSKSEWEFYNGSLPASPDRTTTYAYLNSTAYLTHSIRNRPTSVTVTDKNGNTISQTLTSYDTSLSSATGFTHHDDTNYGTGNTVRGNLTQSQRLVSGTSNFSTTTKAYDITGQVVGSTDAAGNPTSYTYTDTFFTDGGDASNPVPFTAPAPTNAYLKTTTQGILTTTFGYYWGTGQKALSTDPNSQTTYFHFHDPLDRPTSARFPDSGWTYSVYSSPTEIDTGKGITSTSETTGCPSTSNACRHDQVLLDSLGRIVDKNLVSDSAGQDTVGTAYDSNGRTLRVSNPYRSSSDPTYGWESYVYDGLNRISQVQRADGSVYKTYYGASVGTGGGIASQLCSSSTYGLGYPILKVDEAGKKLQSWTDGFGRLIEVDEPDSTGSLSVSTCHSYDLNNNIITVVQGSETRSFSHDLISRLTTVSNPETGTINYYYTTSGGSLCSGDPSAVCRRTDARGIVTTYSYDNVNRLTAKSYSDSTPTVTYVYDVSSTNGVTISNPKGRLVLTEIGTSEGVMNSYDAMGRVATNWQWPPLNGAQAYYMTYTYDLAGDVIGYTNGEGVAFTQTIDGAGRATGIISTLLDSQHPSTLVTVNSFWPTGMPEVLKYGNNLYEIWFLNNRLQLCRTDVNTVSPTLAHCADNIGGGSIQTLYMNYNEGSADNGNLVTFNASIVTNFNRSYTYDQLNRLSTMTDSYSGAGCKGLSWTYDRWGNRTAQNVTSGTCGQSQLTFNGNNRVTSSGFTYDASGNLTHDASHSYTYDAENRITAVDGGTTASYLYDPLGRRVQKTAGGVTRYYLYDLASRVVAEQQGATWAVGYIYLNGALTAQYSNSTTYFVHKDHLGSTRLMTEMNQSIYDAVDYLPFGEQIAGAAGTSHKFTGKERDTESNLDNFGARYDSSSLGRFMSPDWSSNPSAVPQADYSHPQSLNLYSYARNNPTSIIDPDGHCPKWADRLCSVGQRFDNLFHGLGFRTDQQVEDLHHNAALYLRQHGVNTEALGYAALIKTYQTYTKKNLAVDNTYSGRTSGTESAEENVAARDQNHHMNEQGYGPAQLDKSSPNADAIRGREQQLIEANGGAQSQGGTSGNAINGVSSTNPNRQAYMEAAESEFGEVGAGEYIMGDYSNDPNSFIAGGGGCGPFGDGPCD
jgi:RHS repeat-associated protein